LSSQRVCLVNEQHAASVLLEHHRGFLRGVPDVLADQIAPVRAVPAGGDEQRSGSHGGHQQARSSSQPRSAALAPAWNRLRGAQPFHELGDHPAHGPHRHLEPDGGGLVGAAVEQQRGDLGALPCSRLITSTSSAATKTRSRWVSARSSPRDNGRNGIAPAVGRSG
jgi:hypothetical protein